MVSRVIMITIVAGAIIGLLTGLETTFSNIPQNVVHDFEIWRLLTYPVMDSNFLTLLFTMMSFYRQGPALEMRIGSAAMAATIFSLVLMTGVMYIIVALLLAFNPLVFMPIYMMMGISGFWPILVGIITLDCWANPEGKRKLLCFPCQIPNMWFPLAFISLFAIIGGGIPFDLLSGFAVAALISKDVVAYPLGPVTDALAERLENGILSSLVAGTGFVTRSAAAEAPAFHAMAPSGAGAGTPAPANQGSAGGRRPGWGSIATLGGGGTSGAPAAASGTGAAGGSSAGGSSFLGAPRTLGGAAAPASSVPGSSSSSVAARAGSAKEAARQARLAAMGLASTGPEPSAPPASDEPEVLFATQLGLLQAMGYDREASLAALAASDGDADEAAALLSTQSGV